MNVNETYFELSFNGTDEEDKMQYFVISITGFEGKVGPYKGSWKYFLTERAL